ncbi:hypothetical protein ACFZBU_40800 [Embleya sp. NPDC008237]|uniref:Rv1733c family protein n=1 Tax=Embleya sp. NPDC008237 TaxID=3363978 RepID=UPI0036E7B6E9
MNGAKPRSRGGREPVRRWWRALLGREPMYRRCDVVHLRATLALTILTLLLVPLAIVVAVDARAASGEATRNRQLAREHRVSAVLLTKPPQQARPGAETVTASVRWFADDGVARTGTAQVPLGGSAGGTTHIWLDAAGRPATPPLTHGAILAEELTAGMMAFAGAVVVTTGAFGLEQLLISRRRALAWERDWAAVEPSWSGRIEH